MTKKMTPLFESAFRALQEYTLDDPLLTPLQAIFKRFFRFHALQFQILPNYIGWSILSHATTIFTHAFTILYNKQ